VQEAIAAILPQDSTPERIQKFFTSLCYLWKARNDLRFNNKKWTILKVHYETNADITVATNLLLAEDDPAYTDQQQQVPSRRPRVYTIPALISGPRCYVDAAINPDGGGNPPRSAGIGICTSTHLQSSSYLFRLGCTALPLFRWLKQVV